MAAGRRLWLLRVPWNCAPRGQEMWYGFSGHVLGRAVSIWPCPPRDSFHLYALLLTRVRGRAMVALGRAAVQVRLSLSLSSQHASMPIRTTKDEVWRCSQALVLPCRWCAHQLGPARRHNRATLPIWQVLPWWLLTRIQPSSIAFSAARRTKCVCVCVWCGFKPACGSRVTGVCGWIVLPPTRPHGTR